MTPSRERVERDASAVIADVKQMIREDARKLPGWEILAGRSQEVLQDDLMARLSRC